MAMIYDFPVGVVAQKPRGLGARIAAPFLAFGRMLLTVAEANSRFEKVQRLQRLSDADLAARLASLSPQQFRVLALVAQGLLNKQIADRLDVQERTVKAHLSVIFERLDVRNRTQAGVVLRELELSDPARRLES